MRSGGSQRCGTSVFVGKMISLLSPALQGSTSDLALPQAALPGAGQRNATFCLCISHLARGAGLPTILVPGGPCRGAGLGRRAGQHCGCRMAWAGSAAQRVESCSAHLDPAHTCPDCVLRGLAALPRLPFISSFLQAFEGKPLPLLCQLPLVRCSGSLGLPSCTPSLAVPQALPATACCSLQTLQSALGWEHLNLHNPKAGNFYLPLQRSRSFLSVAVCAGLAEA